MLFSNLFAGVPWKAYDESDEQFKKRVKDKYMREASKVVEAYGLELSILSYESYSISKDSKLICSAISRVGEYRHGPIHKENETIPCKKTYCSVNELLKAVAEVLND